MPVGHAGGLCSKTGQTKPLNYGAETNVRLAGRTQATSEPECGPLLRLSLSLSMSRSLSLSLSISGEGSRPSDAMRACSRRWLCETVPAGLGRPLILCWSSPRSDYLSSFAVLEQDRPACNLRLPSARPVGR